MKIKVYSEIGKLKSVLLHRPGKELENLTPDLLDRLLFDDIPYLKVAREEHDEFAATLKSHGVTIYYIEELVVEALNNSNKGELIHRFIEDSSILSSSIKKGIFNYLSTLSNQLLVKKMIEGIRKNEIVIDKTPTISDYLENEYPFYTDPMPNLLFQRDPFASIGSGIALNNMYTTTRRRETLFADFVFSYHPMFKDEQINKYTSRDCMYTSEGGDVLVLSKELLAIGVSKRTSPEAIDHIASEVFEHEPNFKTILAFNIPKTRAFMHLDTVFTQIDYDVFTIHPQILEKLTVLEITKVDSNLQIKKLEGSLQSILESYLKRPIKLLECGGSDVITSGREQWNDGANTLAIAPGVVVVYSRNHVTNNILRNNGITVLEIPSSELSRGRGGPRCMSMPLEREDI